MKNGAGSMGLDDILKLTVDPLLRARAFRRKGRTWNRQRNGLVDVVDFQASKMSEVGREEFTINAGVFAPEFFHAVWRKRAPTFVREAECVVRARIGDLLPPGAPNRGLDRWWSLDSPETQIVSQRRVEEALTVHFIPFFDSIQSPLHMHRWLESQLSGWKQKDPLHRLYLAIAKCKIGDTAGAMRELEQLRAGVWSERAEAVEQSLFGQTGR